MNVLLIVGEDLKAPSSLVGLLTTSFQPVEIDEVLDDEDFSSSKDWITAIGEMVLGGCKWLLVSGGYFLLTQTYNDP